PPWYGKATVLVRAAGGRHAYGSRARDLQATFVDPGALLAHSHEAVDPSPEVAARLLANPVDLHADVRQRPAFEVQQAACNGDVVADKAEGNFFAHLQAPRADPVRADAGAARHEEVVLLPFIRGEGQLEPPPVVGRAELAPSLVRRFNAAGQEQLRPRARLAVRPEDDARDRDQRRLGLLHFPGRCRRGRFLRLHLRGRFLGRDGLLTQQGYGGA